jgi:hypothetical protein
MVGTAVLLPPHREAAPLSPVRRTDTSVLQRSLGQRRPFYRGVQRLWRFAAACMEKRDRLCLSITSSMPRF